MTTPADLAAEFRNLTLPDRLRLAAELIERGKLALAYSIANTVVIELHAALVTKTTR